MGHTGGGVPPLYTEGPSVARPEAWSPSSGQAPLTAPRPFLPGGSPESLH